MSPALIATSIFAYFLLLLVIAWITSRKADNEAYFLGNRNSPWYVVAFGMLGDSLSGVTFISVPGWVGTSQFSYLQMVLGYLLGYYIIANVLLPLYYKLNLTSIYSYLQGRFGKNSQKTGSFFFLLSRIIGAAFRLYLAISVIQLFVFDQWEVPFWLSASIVIFLMLLYTYRGGIKTLVWTDTLQSAFLLAGVVLSIVAISNELNFSMKDMVSTVYNSEYAKVFFWDWKDKQFFFKQFFSGAFIAVVMTGLDQNMMQKNLSCRSLGDAQKNILWFSGIVVFVNLFFLSLGALLYYYAAAKGIAIPVDPASGKMLTDKLFPMLALEHLGTFAAIVFILGLTAATFSSADSVLTTLTTSFCIDFLDIENRYKGDERKIHSLRLKIHGGFAIVLLLVILLFKAFNNDAVINAVFTAAGYTYGPLLGLFAFGLFNKLRVKDGWVPLVCLLSPLICYLLDKNSVDWFNGYKFGYELLLLNGMLTYSGLWLIRKQEVKN